MKPYNYVYTYTYDSRNYSHTYKYTHPSYKRNDYLYKIHITNIYLIHFPLNKILEQEHIQTYK